MHVVRLLQLPLLLARPCIYAKTTAVRICSTHSQPDEMEHLKNNPFYAKYADKLKNLEESKPDEYQAKLDQLEKEKEKEVKEKREQIAEAKKAQLEQASQTTKESLDSILKLDLIKGRTSEEIAKIWNMHHNDKQFVFAVIPKDEYKDMHQKLLEFPSFLYPIPREQGYEFFLQQFSSHKCDFTPLLAYQAHGYNSPPCLSLHHYTELMEDKGIVLMRGEIDTKVTSVHEAQLLALQVKLYYGIQSALRFNLVRVFNNSPETFSHMDLVREFERYKQDSKDYRESEVD